MFLLASEAVGAEFLEQGQEVKLLFPEERSEEMSVAPWLPRTIYTWFTIL
jgi:hypothetical protein